MGKRILAREWLYFIGGLIVGFVLLSFLLSAIFSKSEWGVFKLNKLAKDISKPSVSFEAPSAWTCDQSVKLPTKQGREECAVCRNSTKEVQAITVDKQRQGVNPGQAVYLCPMTVVVEGQPTP